MYITSFSYIFSVEIYKTLAHRLLNNITIALPWRVIIFPLTLQNERFGVTMNIYKAWNKGYTGRGVTVCIHDPTGVERGNVEIASKYVSCSNAVLLILVACFTSLAKDHKCTKLHNATHLTSN